MPIALASGLVVRSIMVYAGWIIMPKCALCLDRGCFPLLQRSQENKRRTLDKSSVEQLLVILLSIFPYLHCVLAGYSLWASCETTYNSFKDDGNSWTYFSRSCTLDAFWSRSMTKCTHR